MEFDVTVSRLGYVRVDAESKNEAVKIVNKYTKYDDVKWADDWDVTDVEEVVSINKPRFEKYLLTFKCDDEPVVYIATMRQIAKEIGFADCSGATGFEVYGIETDTKSDYVRLVKLWYRHGIERMNGRMIMIGNRVRLYDDYMNMVDEAEYEEH